MDRENQQESPEVRTVVYKRKEYPNYTIDSNGRVYSLRNKIYLKTDTVRNGYHLVSLGLVKGKLVRSTVHRLVVENFIDSNLHDYHQYTVHVNHKDGDKSNNRKDNLEIVTASENALHYYNGEGFKSDPRRISDERRAKIVSLFNEGLTRQQVADTLEIDRGSVAKYLWESSTIREKSTFGKLFHDQLIEIHYLHKILGVSYQGISSELDIKKTMVGRIVRGDRYSKVKFSQEDLVSYSQVRGKGEQAVNDFIRSLKI